MVTKNSLFVSEKKYRKRYFGDAHQCEWVEARDGGNDRYQCVECGKFRMIYGDYEVSEERELDFGQGE